MHKRIRNDECLICESSLLRGLDLYHLIIDDPICFKCREKLKGKIKINKFKGYPLISFYAYNQEVSKLIIRYKDLLDKPLANIFLSEYMWALNYFFKGYKLVLIPSSKTLLERRGFNHLATILADCQLEIVDCLIKSDSVQRFSDNRSDVYFELLDKTLKFNKVIIFDDVMTSGSSMQKAIDLIAPISKKIILISIATHKDLFIRKGELNARQSKVV